MLNDILKLIADVKAGKWADVLRGAGSIIITFGDWYDAFLKPTVGAGAVPAAMKKPTDEELDAAIVELEECCAAPVKQQNDPKGIDPATIFLVIRAVLEFVKWWRARRNQ